MNVRTSVMRGFALLALSAFTLTACDEKTPVEIIENPVVVTVAPQTATINVGQTVNAQAAVTNATNTAVTWSSSNTAVATVSTAGVITGVAAGTAVITATSAQDPTAKGFITVTVNPVVTPRPTLQLVPATATVLQGDSIQLVSIVTGATNTNVTYRTSASGVATVSASGMVRGVAPGTAVITAISAADTTVKQTSTITVATRPANPPVITITPTQVAANVGDTVNFVVNVSNSTNTAFTCRSSTPNVATVVAGGCRVAALSNGTAVITAISSADTTVRVTAQVTVAAVTQPSVSISAVTTNPGGVNIPVNANVAGSFNVVMNVTAGSQTNISRVEVRLNGVTCNTQTFAPPLAPTQGVAQITVVCNTAQLQANGTPLFPNGQYTLTAVAINSANAVVATATYGTLNLNNVNSIRGVVTFDNTLDDTDNNPAPAAVATGGVLWNGGSATIVLTPAIFTGNTVATVTVQIDLNCDGIGDTATRTVTISGGTGTVTYSEANNLGSATPGIDDLQDNSVCFVLTGAADAQSLPVTINNGAGNVTWTGTAGTITAQGATQQVFAIDNVEPVFPGAVAMPATVTANNNYAGANTTFSATGTSPVINAAATDAGVGGVTIRFYAVAANVAVGTQAQMAAAVAGLSPITSAAQLASSTVNNAAYRLIVEATDALGNVNYSATGTFGVDLEMPTIAVGAGSVALNGTINAAANDIVVAVTDTFSGPIRLQARGTIYSVLEVDNDADTEVRCIIDAAGNTAAVGASGVCPLFSATPLVNIGGQTELGTIVVPQAAANNDEGYLVYEVQGVDRAGNLSTTTLTYTTLNDVTAPTAVINIITINNTLGTVRLEGQIRENVDLAMYDTRFLYTGLANVPDELPFVTSVQVSGYGLPLVGVVNVDQTSPVVVRDITDQASANVQASAYGFFASDVAANYSFTSQGIAPAAGGGLVGSFLNAAPTDFDASFVARADVAGAVNTYCLDRSGNGGAGCPTSTTVFAQVRVAPTATNPVSQVFFYAVHPGADMTFGTADDYNILLGSDMTGTPVTGLTDRTYTFDLAIMNSMFPDGTAANPDAFPVFAVAVSTNGSAVMSDILTLNVQD